MMVLRNHVFQCDDGITYTCISISPWSNVYTCFGLTEV